MAESPGNGSKVRTGARTSQTWEEQATASAAQGSHVCDVGFCPISLALSAVQPLRPDAIEHLLVAGREFLLALRAVVDARAEHFTDHDTAIDFEKIDIG